MNSCLPPTDSPTQIFFMLFHSFTMAINAILIWNCKQFFTFNENLLFGSIWIYMLISMIVLKNILTKQELKLKKTVLVILSFDILAIILSCSVSIFFIGLNGVIE